MRGEVASILEENKSSEVQGMVHRYLVDEVDDNDGRYIVAIKDLVHHLLLDSLSLSHFKVLEPPAHYWCHS